MLFYQIEATADNIVKILPQKETWDSLETVRTKVERYRKEETLGGPLGLPLPGIISTGYDLSGRRNVGSPLPRTPGLP